MSLRIVHFCWFVLALLLQSAAQATGYYNFAIDEDALAGAPDQSALNRPLGPADRIFVRDAHFYRVGPDLKPNTADDTRIRIFGVNLSFAANFPNESEAPRIARRLRKLGFNAVRLHHLDTAPDSKPNSARSILTDGPYPTLNPIALTRLKAFLAALKSEGIYANLNLHVGYRFRPGPDGVPALAKANEALPMAGPMHIFHPRLIALQTEYAQKIIRGLGLQEDPALAMVEINNESSLASSWQAWKIDHWNEVIRGPYADELKRQWNQWIIRKYGSTAQACEKWRNCDGHAEQALISPRDTQPPLPASAQGVVRRLTNGWLSAKSWVNQQLGKTENTAGTSLRLLDFMAFIADTERAYLDTLKTVIRNETGPLTPVTGTQTGFGGPLNFASHTSMDYADEHYYLDHYHFPNTAWDSNDWRIRNNSLSGKELPGLLALGLSRDSRKPFVVSEYNQPYPNQQRAEILPIVAAIAALQDWDGLFFFDYADGERWSKTPTSFTLAGDWGKVAMVGQSARIFREALISATPQRLLLPLGEDTRLALAVRHDPRAIRSYAENYNFRLEAGLSNQLAVDTTGMEKQAVPASSPPTRSGQLTYDAKQGTLLLSSEQVLGFFGFPAQGQRLDAGLAKLQLAPSSRGFVAALLTSLDGKPLRQAGRWLFSIPGHLVGSQPGAIPRRPKTLINYEKQGDWWTLETDPTQPGKPSGSRSALGPLWMEQVESRLTLETSARTLTVYPLDGNGQRLPPLASDQIRPITGGFEIHLQTGQQKLSPWYEMIGDTAARAFPPVDSKGN